MEIQSANIQQHSIAGPIEKGWSFNDITVKNGIAYTTIIIVVMAAISYLFGNIAEGFSTKTARYIFTLIYLLTGFAHVFTFPKWLPQLHDIKGFTYTVLLAAAGSLVVVSVFLIMGFNGGLLPLAAAIAFVLPSAISLCWYYFSGITSSEYQAWYMPAEMKPEKRMSLMLNGLFFKIKIKVNENDNEATIFNVTLSGKLTIGAMFCRFLYDQKGNIEITDTALNEYGWLFYVERWMAPKLLDPALSLNENVIKEDDIILIERVKK